MQYIDLHVHSCYSDGTMTPKELVDLAIDSNLVAMALTDHDTVDGVAEAIAAARDRNIQVIPGVELSCEHTISPSRKKEIHILGYKLDYTQPEFVETLSEIARERDNRNRQMCENLNAAGFPIDYESLTARFDGTILTWRRELYQVLILPLRKYLPRMVHTLYHANISHHSPALNS